MKREISVFLVFTVLFLFSAIGCADQNENATVTVVDMVGDTVEIPKNPQNVAVIARAAADMMVGFGLGENVDGMYYSVLNNPWVELIYPESVNYYSYQYNESAELFLSREVDLVLAPEQYIAEGLRDSGVNAITVSLYGTPSYEDYIYYLSDLIKQIWPDSKSKVDKWQSELDDALTEVSETLIEYDIERRTVYYVRGDKDKGIGYTDTGYSLLETVYNNYLNMTYIGRNFESSKPSAEEIMAQNPDVIVVGGIYQNKLIDDLYSTEPYNLLDAVKYDQVFNIPIGFVMWEQNSMVLPLFIYDQANKLYPDIFDYDIVNLTQDKFETYFDIELTDNQINRMLSGLNPDGSQPYNS